MGRVAYLTPGNVDHFHRVIKFLQCIEGTDKSADGGPTVRVPTADDEIDEGDRLVVAGTKAAVESLDIV